MLNSASPPKNIKKMRDLSLDGIRFLALIMVITIHVSAKGFPDMRSHWWAVNFYDSVSRSAVPLFFMVTGALLLSKETNAATSLKRIWRIALPLLVWSVVYLCWFQYTGTSFARWIPTILRVPVAPHFWYLYTLIGVYIFLPVMIGFYQIKNRSSQYLALAGWFLGSSVAPLLYALNQKTYLGIEFGFLHLYAGYIVIGAMLYRAAYKMPVSLWCVVGAWAVCSAAIAILTWKHSITVGHADETYYVYSCPFVIGQAVFSFVLLRSWISQYLLKCSIVAKFLESTAELNFGIYIVHVLVMFWLDLSGINYNFINPWIAIPATSLAILVASGVLVYSLQKIPLIKQTLPA